MTSFIRVLTISATSFILFVLSSCTVQSNTKATAIAVITIDPINIEERDNKPVSISLYDTVRIYFVKDVTIYECDALRSVNTNEPIKGTERYFIHAKGSKDGYRFENIRDTNEKLFNADSFTLKKADAWIKITYPQPTHDYSLKHILHQTDTSRIDMFAFTGPPDDNNPDTLFYYFVKKFPETPYTFSHELDSITGMKLVKFRMFYKTRFSKRDNMNLPDHETRFELLALNTGIPKEVLELYDRFKKKHL